MRRAGASDAGGAGAVAGRRGGVHGAALVLGVGLGGFVDGIVLHQLLQWHHMLTDEGSFPRTTVLGLEGNTVADGLFHVAAWMAVVVGLFLLVRAAGNGAVVERATVLGGLLTGWGLFNLVEGVVDHHLLTLHHVRDDVAEPLPWDIGFLAVGALLVVVGRFVAGRAEPGGDERS